MSFFLNRLVFEINQPKADFLELELWSKLARIVATKWLELESLLYEGESPPCCALNCGNV